MASVVDKHGIDIDEDKVTGTSAFVRNYFASPY